MIREFHFRYSTPEIPHPIFVFMRPKHDRLRKSFPVEHLRTKLNFTRARLVNFHVLCYLLHPRFISQFRLHAAERGRGGKGERPREASIFSAKRRNFRRWDRRAGGRPSFDGYVCTDAKRRRREKMEREWERERERDFSPGQKRRLANAKWRCQFRELLVSVNISRVLKVVLVFVLRSSQAHPLSHSRGKRRREREAVLLHPLSRSGKGFQSSIARPSFPPSYSFAGLDLTSGTWVWRILRNFL